VKKIFILPALAVAALGFTAFSAAPAHAQDLSNNASVGNTSADNMQVPSTVTDALNRAVTNGTITDAQRNTFLNNWQDWNNNGGYGNYLTNWWNNNNGYNNYYSNNNGTRFWYRYNRIMQMRGDKDNDEDDIPMVQLYGNSQY